VSKKVQPASSAASTVARPGVGDGAVAAAERVAAERDR
jgi:hypothetical protein